MNNYFLIDRVANLISPGVPDSHQCTVVSFADASRAMQLDEHSIARDIEECGRCDTDTHTLIPVEAFK